MKFGSVLQCFVDADRILGCQSVVLCNVMLNLLFGTGQLQG